MKQYSVEFGVELTCISYESENAHGCPNFVNPCILMQIVLDFMHRLFAGDFRVGVGVMRHGHRTSIQTRWPITLVCVDEKRHLT